MTTILVILSFLIGVTVATVFWVICFSKEYTKLFDKERMERRNEISIIASNLLLKETQIKSLQDDIADLHRRINTKN